MNFMLALSANCVITNSTGAKTFTISATKPYASAVTFSTQDSRKLLKQLKSGLKRTFTQNKNQFKITT